ASGDGPLHRDIAKRRSARRLRRHLSPSRALRLVLPEARNVAPRETVLSVTSVVGGRRSGGRGDAEDRVAGGDLEQLGVGGVGADPVEEHADLELPALE